MAAKPADAEPGSSGQVAKVRHFPDPGPSKARKKENTASGSEGKKNEGDKPEDGPPAPEETLKDERLRMVIDRLYGPQAHYRAAQKFLKNRTLRKISETDRMTLYDRIMAYRKLKEGDEVEEGYAQQPSPDKQAAAESEKTGSPQKRAPSSHSIKSAQAVADNNHNNNADTTRAKSSENANNESPAKRAASRNSRASGTPRKLERSDTSFASVDISDLTELDDEKTRSPTPQPTFEDHHYTAQVGRTHQLSSPPPPLSSSSSPSPTAQPPPLVKRQTAWAESREVPESPEASRTSPECFEPSRTSPVIKELKPAYVEVPRIVANNYRYSSYTYLLRSKSVPDISTTTEDTTSDNLPPSDSHGTPRTAPGSYRGRTKRKRRSIPAGHSLSLAQRVYLARQVESYIASNESQTEKQVGHNYEEKTTARDVQVEIDDREEKVTEKRSSSALASTAVTTATVATAARAHTSQEDSREVKKTQEETKETQKEKNTTKETHKTQEEVKRSDSRQEKRQEKHERSVEDTAKTAVVAKEAYSERSTKKEEISEKEESSKETKEESSKQTSEESRRSDSRSDKREEKIEETAKESIVAKAVNESQERSGREEKTKEVEKREDREDRTSKEEDIQKKTSEETKSEKSDMEKNKSERSSSRTSNKEARSEVSEKASTSAAAAAAERSAPKPAEAPAVQAEETPILQAVAATAAAAAPSSSAPKKARPGAKSSATRAKEEEEEDKTIKALDRLADKNLNSLLGKDDGGGSESPSLDKDTLDKVFSPKFQAELDDFLRTT
ncbi:hypothetical protein V1264_008305 [Littorina saxatilis]|uniref:Uncharacterized protein n=1 Tax=Littorina saxatilis TaxID=31220 RepID=A0AAN9G2Q4_9CAEN